MAAKRYRLIGTDGKPYESATPGTLGGHRKLKIYGRLDCPSALRWIAKGKETAVAAGYRPCEVCCPDAYAAWKAEKAAA